MYNVPIVPSVPSVLIMPVVLIAFMLLVVQMATRYKKYRIAGDIAYVCEPSTDHQQMQAWGRC